MADPQHIGREAAHFLRRELERMGVAGELTPKIGNPRMQGWIYGFALALGDALALSESEKYTLQAMLYVKLFEGTLMGEQLGLESLIMAQRTESMPGAKGMLVEFRAGVSEGGEAGRCFAAFQIAAASLARTLDQGA